jgi:hypothetical protein
LQEEDKFTTSPSLFDNRKISYCSVVLEAFALWFLIENLSDSALVSRKEYHEQGVSVSKSSSSAVSRFGEK